MNENAATMNKSTGAFPASDEGIRLSTQAHMLLAYLLAADPEVVAFAEQLLDEAGAEAQRQGADLDLEFNDDNRVAAVWLGLVGRRRFRYSTHHPGLDIYKSPVLMVREIKEKGRAYGDCGSIAGLFVALLTALGVRTIPILAVMRRGLPRGYEIEHIYIDAKGSNGRTISLDPCDPSGEQVFGEAPPAISTEDLASPDGIEEVPGLVEGLVAQAPPHYKGGLRKMADEAHREFERLFGMTMRSRGAAGYGVGAAEDDTKNDDDGGGFFDNILDEGKKLIGIGDDDDDGGGLFDKIIDEGKKLIGIGDDEDAGVPSAGGGGFGGADAGGGGFGSGGAGAASGPAAGGGGGGFGGGGGGFGGGGPSSGAGPSTTVVDSGQKVVFPPFPSHGPGHGHGYSASQTGTEQTQGQEAGFYARSGGALIAHNKPRQRQHQWRRQNSAGDSLPEMAARLVESLGGGSGGDEFHDVPLDDVSSRTPRQRRPDRPFERARRPTAPMIEERRDEERLAPPVNTGSPPMSAPPGQAPPTGSAPPAGSAPPEFNTPPRDSGAPSAPVEDDDFGIGGDFDGPVPEFGAEPDQPTPPQQQFGPPPGGSGQEPDEVKGASEFGDEFQEPFDTSAPDFGQAPGGAGLSDDPSPLLPEKQAPAYSHDEHIGVAEGLRGYMKRMQLGVRLDVEAANLVVPLISAVELHWRLMGVDFGADAPVEQLVSDEVLLPAIHALDNGGWFALAPQKQAAIIAAALRRLKLPVTEPIAILEQRGTLAGTPLIEEEGDEEFAPGQQVFADGDSTFGPQVSGWGVRGALFDSLNERQDICVPFTATRNGMGASRNPFARRRGAAGNPFAPRRRHGASGGLTDAIDPTGGMISGALEGEGGGGGGAGGGGGTNAIDQSEIVQGPSDQSEVVQGPVFGPAAPSFGQTESAVDSGQKAVYGPMVMPPGPAININIGSPHGNAWEGHGHDEFHDEFYE